MNYLMIYKKRNGNIIYRTSKTKPTYEKGNITSMGWEVLDIQRIAKGRIMSCSEYDTLLYKRYKLRNLIALPSQSDIRSFIEFMIVVLLLYVLFVK